MNTTTYSHAPARLRALHDVLAQTIRTMPTVPQRTKEATPTPPVLPASAEAAVQEESMSKHPPLSLGTVTLFTPVHQKRAIKNLLALVLGRPERTVVVSTQEVSP